MIPKYSLIQKVPRKTQKKVFESRLPLPIGTLYGDPVDFREKKDIFTEMWTGKCPAKFEVQRLPK